MSANGPVASVGQLIDWLRSQTCPGCSGVKESGKSFCGACYWRLSKPQRIALYRRLGKGYEQAVHDAMKTLRQPAPAGGAGDEKTTNGQRDAGGAAA